MALFDFLRSRSPEDRFAELVMRRMAARGWPHPLSYDREKFAIATSPEGGFFNLENVFRDLQTYPKRERAAQIDRITDLLFDPPSPKTFEEAAPLLLPLIRNLTHLQAMVLEDESRSERELWQPHRRIAGTLGVILGIDKPNSISLVNAEMLNEWGCGFDAALKAAIANLAAKSPVQFQEEEGGFLSAAYGDRYDSSRLLLPELFRGLSLKGEPVAIPVSRDLLVVAGSDDLPALNAMADFAEWAFAEDTRPTSMAPLRLRGEGWVPFTPEALDLATVRELTTKHTLNDYAVQTPRLQAQLERAAVGTFVPPLEGGPTTWTSWTEGATHSLPRAFAIGLTNRRGEQLLRLWSDVERVCGPFTEDATLYPSRYTPPAWPSDAAWARLRDEFREPE